MTDIRRTAIALAGGELERDFRTAGYAVRNKAYLEIGGTTMIERVLRALRGASSIGRIRCVTQPDAFREAFPGTGWSLADDVIAPGADLIDSLLLGFEGLDDGEMVIVAATDIPLVTPAAIDAFSARAAEVDCDVGYAFVRRQAHDRAYPQVRHTWVRLKDGTFCGAGVSTMRAGAAKPIASLIRKFAAARKSPRRLATLFSPLLALRLALGMVGIQELEGRADRLSGLRCRGIACDEAELAVNVDRLEDLLTVKAILLA